MPSGSTHPIDFGPFLTNRFGEHYLPAVNRETFSENGAVPLFRHHFGNTFNTPDTLYLIVGTDSGLLPHFLLQQPLPPGSRYLFIEFNSLQHRLTTENPLPPLPANSCTVANPNSWQQTAKTWGIEQYLFASSVQLVQSLSVVDGFFPPYMDLFNQVKQWMDAFHTEVAINTGTRDFMQRSLENIGENRLPAKLLQGTCPNQTAVLLAGGPSLDDILPWVQENRQHMLLLSIARITPRLLEANITPDIVFSIDPQDESFHESRQMLELWQKSLFVHMYHVHSSLLGQWRGRNLFMGLRFPWPTPLNPDNLFFEGITVANQALGVAIDMGVKQVILGGFDLCFTREGFTHANGSLERQAGPSMHTPELVVETNGGWRAESRHDFHLAAASLAKMAQEAEGRCHVINPAPGAMKINHVHHIPLEQVTLPPIQGEPLLSHLPPDPERTHHYRTMLQELGRMRKEVDAVRTLTREALICNERLFGRQGKPADFRFKKKMDAIEASLDGKHADAATLVKKWGVREFLRLARPDQERAWSDAEIEETGRRYYEIYRESASAVIRLLEQAVQRLNSRLEEERPQPNAKTLLEQWQRDEQPGRALVWQDHRLAQGHPLPPLIQEALPSLEQAFHYLVHEKPDPNQTRWQEKQHPRLVRARGFYFFQHQDGERLQGLISGLQQSGLDAEMAGAVELLQGYALDLAGEREGAIAAYLRATESPWMAEEAWRRLATIALEARQFPVAIDALGRLAELSPSYRPQFGDLLRITGQPALAARVWRDYLNEAPGDAVTGLKLARLHREHGEVAEAIARVRAILAQQPDHAAARELLHELERNDVPG